jgi:hypothetical protein
MVEHLPSIFKVLGLTPVWQKKNKANKKDTPNSIDNIILTVEKLKTFLPS